MIVQATKIRWLSSDSDAEYQAESGKTREPLKGFGITTEKLQEVRNKCTRHLQTKKILVSS